MIRGEQLCTGFWARTKTVIYFLIAYIIAVIVMDLLLSPITTSDLVSAEISVAMEKTYLASWYSQGIMENYLHGLLWDFVYMIAYGGLFFSLIVAQSCRAAVKITNLMVFMLFPVAAVGFDVLENLIEIVVVFKFPDVKDWVIVLSTVVSWLKWISILVTVGIILYLAVRRFFVKH